MCKYRGKGERKEGREKGKRKTMKKRERGMTKKGALYVHNNVHNNVGVKCR
jgi:hypothetical protein